MSLQQGVTKTFHSVLFSPFFHGRSFSDVCTLVFELFELVVVAVETQQQRDASSKRDGKVLLNPGPHYQIG
jgi:hypothetical protein